jgi:hypothetical protein
MCIRYICRGKRAAGSMGGKKTGAVKQKGLLRRAALSDH